MPAVPRISRVWRPTRLRALFSLCARWTIEISDAVLVCRSRRRSLRIPLTDLSRIDIKARVFWSKATLVTPEGSFSFSGMAKLAAEEMSGELRRAAVAAKIDALKNGPDSLMSWAWRVEQALDLEHWVTREEAENLWSKKPTEAEIGFDLAGFTRDLEDYPDLADGVGEILSDAISITRPQFDARAKGHNQHFLEAESIAYAEFFRTVEKSPLNKAQVRSCICFDNRVLTVAAAGSGKTSTMIAKAGYALTRGIARSDEILMLAFNADAAEEIRQRVSERLSHLGVKAERVSAKTFHKLGLDIIGEATGRKPRVAPWLEQGRDVEAVAEIITDLCKTSLKFRSAWALYRMVFSRGLSSFEEEPEADYWESSKSRAGFRTMQGEVVKSQEECLIADWLFCNGVNYEYERPYEIDTVTPEHSQYQPDFFYPDAKVYHEHFALDEAGNPPERFGQKYLDGVEWKRAIHGEHGTTLLETTSYGIRNGDDFDRLYVELEGLGIKFDPSSDREVPGRAPPPELEVARTFRVFLTHAKSNQLSVEDLRSRVSESRGTGFRARLIVFLSLYEKIAEEWDRRLRAGGYVDFEDMLNLATEIIYQGKWRSPYRLVMVDEFQDVSKSRVELAKALVKGQRRFLFAVGDDWQAINRFAGADLSLMSRFRETFGPAQQLALEETFRSPQPLCDIASDFILRNPAQIRKKMISSQPIFGAPVQVYLCAASSREALLEKHLQALYDKLGSPKHPTRDDGTVSVILLGRYNHDMPSRLKQWRDGFAERIRLDFLTVHSSKGLEADYVFIVKMNSGKYSFPSTIEDDPILLLAMPGADDYRFAEERRLFYVALTRARRMVVIYGDERFPSPFLDELQADDRVIFAGGKKSLCPLCREGSLVRREGPSGDFMGCSRFPNCRYTGRNAEAFDASN